MKPEIELSTQDEDLGKGLWDLARKFEEEEKIVRQRQIRRWKRLDYFWHNVQYLLDSDQWEFNFKSPELDPDEFDDVTYYTKIYNIFKAHGESIIAALSVDFPRIIFPPDDAENRDDLDTSKGITDIAELIRKHNRADLQCIKALFTLYIQGMIAGRTFSEENKKYGVIKIPEYQNETVTVCPDCEVPMNGSCPNCQSPGPGIEKEIQTIKGYNEEFKKRQMLEIYGPINVLVPAWCTDTKRIPFLRLSEDWHETEAKHKYPHIKSKIRCADDPEQWEQWARRSFESYTTRDGLCVVKQYWFTPCTFTNLPDNLYDLAVENYPEGILAVFVNDVLAEIKEEDLHDTWELSFDPRSRHIHADPIGMPLAPIQEVTNEVFNLTLQSVEQGIPQTFADSEVLDFQAYKNSDSKPGEVYPVKVRTGKNVQESFATLKTATVSQEIESFTDRLDQMGQFVVGSFPSIFGGKLEGSRTAAEYSMSGQRAMQRLSTTWKVVSWFWAGLLDKASRQFVKNMQTDEKFTRKQGNSFINVWIRRAQLQGSIGDVEPEVVDNLPISASQKLDFLIKLLEFKSPQIDEFVFHPNNRATIARFGGMSDLYIPGEFDQQKQFAEIDELIKSKATEIPDEMIPGESISVPSVRTDPDADDAMVHIQTCKAFLVSERGRLVREENQEGWDNVLAHMKMHQLDVLGQTAIPHENSPAGTPPSSQVQNTGA